MKSIECTVSILSAISVALSLDEAISQVRQHADTPSHILNWFYSHYPLHTRYMPASLSYLMCVSSSTSSPSIVVTSQ